MEHPGVCDVQCIMYAILVDPQKDLEDRCYQQPHFTDKETESQKGYGIPE